jgi:hypothetical protein
VLYFSTHTRSSASAPYVCHHTPIHLAVECTLKAQLIVVIDSLCINELRDDTMGFTKNATTLQLLTHLHTTDGEVRSNHLEANIMCLDHPWNPLDQIETVWIKAQECHRFAAAGHDPISKSTAVRKTVSMFNKSRVPPST